MCGVLKLALVTVLTMTVFAPTYFRADVAAVMQAVLCSSHLTIPSHRVSDIAPPRARTTSYLHHPAET